MDSKSALQKIFSDFGHRPLLIDHSTGSEFTYQEFLNETARVQEYLRSKCIQGDSRIVIISENRLEIPLVMMASWGLGAMTIPLNFELGGSQLKSLLDDINADLVVVSDIVPQDTVEKLGADEESLLILDSQCDYEQTALFSVPASSINSADVFAELDDEGVFLRIYTSGSTAAPKGIDVKFSALFSNEQLFCETLNITCENRFYNILPMSYLGGVHNLFLLPLSVGASFVLDQPLGPRNVFSFWENVSKYKINTLWFSPTMMTMLMAIRDEDDVLEITQGIRLSLVGMAPLSLSLKDSFQSRFNLELLENYALSETAFITTQYPGNDYPEMCKGSVLNGVDLKIVDSNGQKVASGDVGELVVDTPHLMHGYYNAPESDLAAVQADGFHTGDLGYVKDDLVFVTGRIKDLIIRGGLNISPALVEAEIAQLEYVLSVAVVGISSDFYGEEVAAAFVLSDPSCEEKLDDDLGDLLPNFQCPKDWIVLGSLPLGSTGKVDKKRIKVLIEANL